MKLNSLNINKYLYASFDFFVKTKIGSLYKLMFHLAGYYSITVQAFILFIIHVSSPES